MTNLFYLWYTVLERFSLLLDWCGIEWGLLKEVDAGICINPVGDRSPVMRCNSLSRQNSTEVLLECLRNDLFQGKTTFQYHSLANMMRCIVDGCARVAYLRYLAKLIKRQDDIAVPLSKLSKTFTVIKRRSQKTVKFRFMFKTLRTFLNDMEQGKVENMARLVQILCDDMLARQPAWWLMLEHSLLRAENAPDNVYEASLATLSMFQQHGAHLHAGGLTHIRASPNRIHNALLTLFMICGVEHCADSFCGEINVTEYSGTERIFTSDWTSDFTTTASHNVSPSSPAFKDCVFWDVMENGCCELVESTWSVSRLRRAMWALQHGRRFVKRSDYDKIMILFDKQDKSVDLSGFDSRMLLALSIGGFARFHANGGDAIFRMVEDDSARHVLHGRLPRVSVQDLIDLHVLRDQGKQTYVMHLDCIDVKYKADLAGDGVSFTKHTSNKSFSVKPCLPIL